MTDLGYVNGWGANVPLEYEAHKLNTEHGNLNPHPAARAHREQMVITNPHRGVTRYECPACGIAWSLDSGD